MINRFYAINGVISERLKLPFQKSQNNNATDTVVSKY